MRRVIYPPHFFCSLRRLLPFQGAFQQSDEGYGTKPGCNKDPGSFFAHGCAPFVSVSIPLTYSNTKQAVLLEA